MVLSVGKEEKGRKITLGLIQGKEKEGKKQSAVLS